MPRTSPTPCSAAAAAASSQPPTVSWSVMASTSTPAAEADASSCDGVSVPSLTVEWACRSMTDAPALTVLTGPSVGARPCSWSQRPATAPAPGPATHRGAADAPWDRRRPPLRDPLADGCRGGDAASCGWSCSRCRRTTRTARPAAGRGARRGTSRAVWSTAGGAGTPSGLGGGVGAGPVAVGHRRRSAGLLAAPGLEVVGLRHHDLAAEDAHDRAVLLVADRLDVDDAAVVLGGRLPLVENGRLAVDRVAVEGRGDVAQRLDLEVGDRLAGDVGHRHAEQQRVDVVADDDVLPELRRSRGVVRVEVERVVVHREQAEEVVVVLRHRLAGPVPIDG